MLDRGGKAFGPRTFPCVPVHGPIFPSSTGLPIPHPQTPHPLPVSSTILTGTGPSDRVHAGYPRTSTSASTTRVTGSLDCVGGTLKQKSLVRRPWSSRGTWVLGIKDGLRRLGCVVRVMGRPKSPGSLSPGHEDSLPPFLKLTWSGFGLISFGLFRVLWDSTQVEHLPFTRPTYPSWSTTTTVRRC